MSVSLEGKSRAERRLMLQALRVLDEQSLVESGVATYEALGYGVPGQGPAAFKLIEFLTISAEIERINRRPKRGQD